MEAEKTIVAFHTGKGGRYNNAGHRSYAGIKIISDFLGELSLTFENEWEVNYNISLSEDNEDLKSLFAKAMDQDEGAILQLANAGHDLGDLGYGREGIMLISCEEVERGTGTIEFDGQYNTICCMFLSECDEEDIKLIAESGEIEASALVRCWHEYMGIPLTYYAVYDKEEEYQPNECLTSFDTEEEARAYVNSENAGHGFEKLYYEELCREY